MQLPGGNLFAGHLQDKGIGGEGALQVLCLQVLGTQCLYDDLMPIVLP